MQFFNHATGVTVIVIYLFDISLGVFWFQLLDQLIHKRQ